MDDERFVLGAEIWLVWLSPFPLSPQLSPLGERYVQSNLCFYTLLLDLFSDAVNARFMRGGAEGVGPAVEAVLKKALYVLCIRFHLCVVLFVTNWPTPPVYPCVCVCVC